jgi:hypothetical protein
MKYKYRTTGNRFQKYERSERRCIQEYGLEEAKRLGLTKNKLSQRIAYNQASVEPRQRCFTALEIMNNNFWNTLRAIKETAGEPNVFKYSMKNFSFDDRVKGKQPLRTLVNKRGGFWARVKRSMKVLTSLSLCLERFIFYFYKKG